MGFREGFDSQRRMQQGHSEPPLWFKRSCAVGSLVLLVVGLLLLITGVWVIWQIVQWIVGGLQSVEAPR